jgi:hypothetical protein
MPLVRIIYLSKYKLLPSFADYMGQLKDILASSQRNNKPRNVTGALLFDDEYFVQALEGDEADVKVIFDKICQDDRHFNLTVVEKANAPSRVFANWWMAGLLKAGQTAALFEPYQRDGRFDPLKMTANEVLSLMQALTVAGVDRRLAVETGPAFAG